MDARLVGTFEESPEWILSDTNFQRQKVKRFVSLEIHELYFSPLEPSAELFAALRRLRNLLKSSAKNDFKQPNCRRFSHFRSDSRLVSL